MDIHVNGFYKVVMFFATVFTLGLGGIGMWLQMRIWPSRIDKEGIALRNGKHVTWGELTDTRAVTVVNPRGNRITGRLELVFGKTKVKIVPQSLKEGQSVIVYINEILGTELETG